MEPIFAQLGASPNPERLFPHQENLIMHGIQPLILRVFGLREHNPPQQGRLFRKGEWLT